MCRHFLPVWSLARTILSLHSPGFSFFWAIVYDSLFPSTSYFPPEKKIWYFTKIWRSYLKILFLCRYGVKRESGPVHLLKHSDHPKRKLDDEKKHLFDCFLLLWTIKRERVMGLESSSWLDALMVIRNLVVPCLLNLILGRDKDQ